MTSRTKIALLRLAALMLLCLPVGELVWRWRFDHLGPLPAGQAILATGDWAVIFLLLPCRSRLRAACSNGRG